MMYRHKVHIEVNLGAATILLERGETGATTVAIQPTAYALPDHLAHMVEQARTLMDADELDAALQQFQGVGRVKRTDWCPPPHLPWPLSLFEPAIGSVFEHVSSPPPQR
ncbi:MAG TPA: hypothetical protein VGN32_11380 [Ktedonobacterales bacterium]|nr:hypothetical protein [Ktedonobacterales bacterium]